MTPPRSAARLPGGFEFHEELWEQIQERFRRFGRAPTENNRRQAYIPAGATIITNPVGTAPAFCTPVGSALVISLPGVPRELETLFEEAVLPLLRDRFHLKTVFRSVVLHAASAGESQIDEWISDLEKGENLQLG
jgi:molybdopterin-biosynthesis enzyme MoeA-like protein